MARWIAVIALSTLACSGGGDESARTPQGTPQETPQAAPAPRRPTFPAADQFREGERVALRAGAGGGSGECTKLYVADRPIAVVRTYAHFGRGAIALRCVGSAWANPALPTAEELGGVGAQLDGRLAPAYEAIGVAADGSLTFTELDLPDRVSDVAIGARWIAYASTTSVRDAAAGGREADVVGIVFDVPSRSPLQQFLLGTCRMSASGSTAALSLPVPTWSADGRAVTFHGSADGCSFGEVETHPE